MGMELVRRVSNPWVNTDAAGLGYLVSGCTLVAEALDLACPDKDDMTKIKTTKSEKDKH
jgi:hypothetical protein